MKTIVLWIIGCLVLTAIGCSERTDKRTELPLNCIDTAKLKSELKVVVRAYIKAHPRYKTFLLTPTEIPEENWLAYIEPYFLIGPAFDGLYNGGEFGFTSSYPTSYFNLDGHIVFVKTIQEDLTIPDKAAIDAYNRLAEPQDTFDKDTPTPYVYPIKSYLLKAWVMRTGHKRATELLSTRADTFATIKRIPCDLPNMELLYSNRKARKSRHAIKKDTTLSNIPVADSI